MKKYTLILALTTAALLCACGSKQTENVQTQAAATAPAPAETTAAAGPAADAIPETKPASSVELPEEYEQQFFEGIVTEYSGTVIAVENDSAVMSFDISSNEEDPDNPVVRGCYVEVSYADAPANDIYPSDSVTVMNDNEQLAQAENRDPVIYGRLLFMDINEISLLDDAGRTIEFQGNIARKVAFGDIKAGDSVAITYCGTINREDQGEGEFGGIPYAIKVVALDALKTEDAAANYITGTVSSVSGGNMLLSTEITDLECVADPSVFEGLSEEDRIKAYYTGSLADIVVNIVKTEPV